MIPVLTKKADFMLFNYSLNRGFTNSKTDVAGFGKETIPDKTNPV